MCLSWLAYWLPPQPLNLTWCFPMDWNTENHLFGKSACLPTVMPLKFRFRWPFKQARAVRRWFRACCQKRLKCCLLIYFVLVASYKIFEVSNRCSLFVCLFLSLSVLTVPRCKTLDISRQWKPHRKQWLWQSGRRLLNVWRFRERSAMSAKTPPIIGGNWCGVHLGERQWWGHAGRDAENQ